VTLAAFFMSKYEMTQGQWQRFTGGNPSKYGPDWSWKGVPPVEAPIHQNQPWNPVEQVTWLDCRDVLHRLGLVLPTEAQWEYAARAGTDSVWWTGNEKESIDVEGAGNLADGLTKKKGGPSAWAYEDWLEDGWAVHAPVGTFLANGFGLHDTIGNVWEWCRDRFGGYDGDVQPGDGLRILRKVTDPRDRVSRGGHFGSTAARARSAYRSFYAAESGGGTMGVRPARVITE
jgi:formylglycine-generating enzyme required for sulfatase activity